MSGGACMHIGVHNVDIKVASQHLSLPLPPCLHGVPCKCPVTSTRAIRRHTRVLRYLQLPQICCILIAPGPGGACSHSRSLGSNQSTLLGDEQYHASHSQGTSSTIAIAKPCPDHDLFASCTHLSS